MISLFIFYKYKIIFFISKVKVVGISVKNLSVESEFQYFFLDETFQRNHF